MKNKTYQWILKIAVGLLLVGNTIAAEQVLLEQQPEEDKDRFTFSARLGFNIHAKFKDSGSAGAFAATSGRRTPGDPNRPGGDPYNYDNGYIYNDFSGSSDGLTWYWGYDDRASQYNSSANNAANFNAALPDESILLTRTTAVSGGGGQSANPDEPCLGFEVTYDHEFGRHGNLRYGLEAAFNYLNVNQNAHSAGPGTVIQETDAFGTGGVNPPGSPYEHPFSGGGTVISNTPMASLFSTNAAALAGQDKFNADIFGFRLGPYLEFPLGKKFYLSFSGGLAMNIVSADASWNVTATTATGSITAAAHGSDCDLMWGAYLGGSLSYKINRRWAANVGVQWEDLSRFTQNFGPKQVELDMSGSIFVTIGLSYSF